MHIADASARAAVSLIRREHATNRLGAVALELDPPRASRLRGAIRPDDTLLSHLQSVASRRAHSPFVGILEVAFAGLYRMLHRLGFAGGVEFQAALRETAALDIPLVLIDRDLPDTMARVADGLRKDLEPSRALSLLRQLTTPSTTRMETHVERRAREAFTAILKGDVDEGQRLLTHLIDRDSVEQLTRPLREFAPNVSTAILDERDVYMTKELVRTVAKLPPGKDSVVAIVGMAHVDGIVREWRRRGMHEPLS